MTIITAGQLQAFRERLRQAERSRGTVENYLRAVRAFDAWLGGTPVAQAPQAINRDLGRFWITVSSRRPPNSPSTLLRVQIPPAAPTSAIHCIAGLRGFL